MVVEGTTVGSCNQTVTVVCGPNGQTCTYVTPIPGCSTATHTPSIYNSLNGVGGWSTGPASAPFSFMTYSTTTSVALQPGQEVSGSIKAQVTCSVIGVIFLLELVPKVHFGSDFVWFDDPIVVDPLRGKCNWAIANKTECSKVAHCVRDELTDVCGDKTGPYTSLLDTVGWFEAQWGVKIKGGCLYNSKFDTKAGSHSAVGACTAAPPHWGKW